MADLNSLQSKLNEEIHKVKEKTNELETLQKKLNVLQSTEVLLKNLTDQNLYLTTEIEQKRNHIDK